MENHRETHFILLERSVARSRMNRNPYGQLKEWIAAWKHVSSANRWSDYSAIMYDKLTFISEHPEVKVKYGIRFSGLNPICILIAEAPIVVLVELKLKFPTEKFDIVPKDQVRVL